MIKTIESYYENMMDRTFKHLYDNDCIMNGGCTKMKKFQNIVGEKMYQNLLKYVDEKDLFDDMCEILGQETMSNIMHTLVSPIMSKNDVEWIRTQTQLYLHTKRCEKAREFKIPEDNIIRLFTEAAKHVSQIPKELQDILEKVTKDISAKEKENDKHIVPVDKKPVLHSEQVEYPEPSDYFIDTTCARKTKIVEKYNKNKIKEETNQKYGPVGDIGMLIKHADDIKVLLNKLNKPNIDEIVITKDSIIIKGGKINDYYSLSGNRS